MVKVNNLTPLISIILPTYNRAWVLEKAIKSIIVQTYSNWELIIVDNCSKDDTDKILEGFDDDRIKVLKINNKGSIGKSRNLGIENSTGELIAFIDSDDTWFENKLEVCASVMTEKVDLVYHDLSISQNGDLKKNKKIKSRILIKPVINDLLINGNPISNSSVLIRRKIFKKIGTIIEDLKVNPSVDYHTWLKLALHTDSFHYVQQTLGTYLVHPAGESQRDMSISDSKVISEFSSLVSKEELQYIQKGLNYVSGRFKYTVNEYRKAEISLKKSLTFRNPKFLAKALYMLFMIKLKTVTFIKG